MSSPRRVPVRRVPRRPPPTFDSVSYSHAPSSSPPASPPRSNTSSSGRSQQKTSGIAGDVARASIGAGYGPYSFDPSVNRPRRRAKPGSHRPALARSETLTANWGPHLDDMLHNHLPESDNTFTDKVAVAFSRRGWTNAFALAAIFLALLALFLGYPLSIFLTTAPSRPHANGAFNLGGINATGQVPALGSRFPQLIDPDTPEDALEYTSPDGEKYELVFSDEFNEDGRTFYPGDDPYWEAVDLHYWPTGDLEWYDPAAVTTRDGKLVITLSKTDTHDLEFQSGMLQSWNKFCVTTGYVEVSLSLPGSPSQVGFWPGVWLLGNLARAGYGATTDGTWPYTYDSCDVGTFPNQTTQNGEPAEGAGISYLSGQRLSSCTCPHEDHPGPHSKSGAFVGRGAPELDILEALVEIDGDDYRGQVSQSYQVAPFDAQRAWNNASAVARVDDAARTKLNRFVGNEYQETLSALTYVDADAYDGGDGYARFGVECLSTMAAARRPSLGAAEEASRSWTAPARVGICVGSGGGGGGGIGLFHLSTRAAEATAAAPRLVADGDADGLLGRRRPIELRLWFSDPARRDAGYVNWYAQGRRTWGITAAAIGPDSVSGVGQRLISEEPMYLILNLGISPSFQTPDYTRLVFPAELFVDYVRVYQRPGTQHGVGCDPPARPTADYIQRHLNAYEDANLTTWAQAGYEVPKNSEFRGC
ncbi:GH16 domain-containing protein [Mycena kentingensis (nom. inval.)]|nr:GH16 domain-containing protein [Mycena kentingensis (nom. inval.)]